MIYKIMI